MFKLCSGKVFFTAFLSSVHVYKYSCIFCQRGAFLSVPALSFRAHCENHSLSKGHQSELKASLEKLDLGIFYVKGSKGMEEKDLCI